ncbi:MAG: hypothetical protein FE048_02890 [Thermoplasmata archaeon]|nr:MAG: hypothetical protein FE048_02890 [Thermoplasmata archaeon]
MLLFIDYRGEKMRGDIVKIICFFIAISFLMTIANGQTTVSQASFFQGHEYVIITTTEFEDAIKSFKIWKESLGYSVKVITTSWISSNYQGRDLQEKIRNFLIDKYDEWGINYVLIVGSRDKIPMRTCYPLPNVHDEGTPTDYYYADLTGNWDKDGDGYFGEYRQDDVDFYPEVYVGRIPSDDPSKIENICRNIINFESDNGAWKKNVLLLGAIIFYENQTQVGYKWHRSDGATLMEECRNDIFEPNGFLFTRMYEEEGIKPSTYEYDYPLNRSNVLSEWKKGYGIVNMLGHANNIQIDRLVWDHDDGDNVPEYPEELKYIAFLRYSDSDDLSVERPPIVCTSGCYQLWTSRNMGRAFMEDGAAVAFIGSTAGSWYNISLIWNDEKDGGTYSINYYFFHYFINHNQKCGNALYNSKVYFYNHFMFTGNNQEWIFRCYDNLYGFNLYGDPSLGLTTKKIDSSPPIVTIEKPKGYLYIFGKEIGPTFFGIPIIIGGITVDVIATDETGIEKIEIWVDNKLKYTTKEEPYEWLWDETVFGKHVLKAVVHDKAGNIAGDEMAVWIFNF